MTLEIFPNITVSLPDGTVIRNMDGEVLASLPSSVDELAKMGFGKDLRIFPRPNNESFYLEFSATRSEQYVREVNGSTRLEFMTF